MTPPPSDDLALVRRLLAGDEPAFEELFDHAFPALCRFAVVRVGGDEHLAEELAQATLCRAVAKLSTFRGEAALHTWLCTICRRLINDHFMRLGSRPPQLSLTEEDPHVRSALEVMSRATTGPEEELHRGELARRVRDVLAALPGHYADALTWKYLQDLSVLEIGGRMQLTAKATESLLSRARRAFRETFGGMGSGIESMVAPPRGDTR
jgi:RNA polymerase sigma-70 factor, ECF subfamily